MDVIQAIKERHSVRQYLDRKIEGDTLVALNEKMSELQSESGLKFVLKMDEPTAFSRMMCRMVKFKNAVNYVAIIGKLTDDLYFKAGYYGEQLVLFAQTIGLNTCWAMLCGKKACMDSIKEGEVMAIGIAIGYGETQGVPHKSKATTQVTKLINAPNWYFRGIEAAMLAPTGMNRQDFKFERDGNKVKLIGTKSKLGQVDKGIVKYHFECGAGKDKFEWDE